VAGTLIARGDLYAKGTGAFLLDDGETEEISATGRVAFDGELEDVRSRGGEKRRRAIAVAHFIDRTSRSPWSLPFPREMEKEHDRVWGLSSRYAVLYSACTILFVLWDGICTPFSGL
jgi:hypothetical protein